MKTNEDVLKQLLRKISSLESRIQFLEEGNPYVKKEDPDYCHKEFMIKTYPENLAVVYCEYDKCSNVRQPKGVK